MGHDTPDHKLAPLVAAAPTPPALTPAGTTRITSEQLFAGASEVQIDHRGVFYRLKQTALGKLILTK